MQRQTAAACAIAGVAVAVALIISVGSATGLFTPRGNDAAPVMLTETTVPATPDGTSAFFATDTLPAAAVDTVMTTAGEQVEYIYVDAPADARGDVDDGDDDDADDGEDDEDDAYESEDVDDERDENESEREGSLTASSLVSQNREHDDDDEEDDD